MVPAVLEGELLEGFQRCEIRVWGYPGVAASSEALPHWKD